MTGIAVLGAGAFGTALAIALAENGTVHLCSRDADLVAEMQQTRRNLRSLPGAVLPENLMPTANLTAALATGGPVLLSVPLQQLRGLLEQYRSVLDGRILVACCKGMELKTGLGPAGVIHDVLPEAYAALMTGPSFAADIAIGLPTALTLACDVPDLGERLQHALSTPTLRLYRTTDVAGAEIGGALKNVIAIACGAAIGAGLGDSARAALMTRGYAEMLRLAEARGGRAETLAGLSGLGDLALTCTSDLSRNYRLGRSLGAGEKFDPKVTVEGAATARAVAAMAQPLDLQMPITQGVVDLLDGGSVEDAMQTLLARPLKEERD
ncbi:NAD(P)H-dependent glycerol-3-phosphate dehydrogenase [Chachezhania sediminis]|uniref:NAD(P)H-dependent glycerol-3-phosphate dehydrogenase n=1 Tax=Chachezhania sediminis TaxID=2599291 RepID=UPI00131E16D3|nr:NAD(P)H-dependent glycerol-3-phosphate dehydrogenase [Chachezhania sediminis]